VGKGTDTYGANLAHVTLAKKMKLRDQGSAPTVGDRVSYVMVKGSKGQKAYELAEDPIYVLNNDIPIDYNHYIENQIKQPLIRIFEPIFGNDPKEAEKQLFNGEHTRSIY
jgi:DNA polymerase delta subunit 1